MRFGLLGTGFWAAEVHGTALAAHEDAEFVGVWGRAPEKARVLADRFGVRAYDDVDALIADVDAVAVALPPDVQAELAERAALAGRHLLLDKPIALTVEAADRLLAAADSTGVASVVFFTKRFGTAARAELAELVAAKPWDSGRAVWCGVIAGSPFGDSPWRQQHGGLWDVGPHALAMLLPVLGPVARVAAFEAPHATTHVLLEHADGAVSTLVLTQESPAAAVLQETVFTGEAGIVPMTSEWGDPVEAFGVAIGELIAAAAAKEEHPVGLAFGREVVAILAAADEARRAGNVVRPG